MNKITANLLSWAITGVCALAVAAHGAAYSAPTGPQLPASAAQSGGVPGGDRSTWVWWWALNKEPFIDLKAAVHAGGVESGQEGFFLGHGQARQAAPGMTRPGLPLIRERIVPALLTLGKEEQTPSVLTAVLMALAKTGAGPAGDPAIEPFIVSHLESPNQEVGETAAVALGVHGDPRSAFLLAGLLQDSVAGREAVGGREVPWRTRAFAAYGLGVLGAESRNEDVRRYAVGRLAYALENDRSASAEVRAACVVAMGRVPLAVRGAVDEKKRKVPTSSSREAQIRTLLDVFDTRNEDDLVRAQVPAALAWLVQSDPGIGGTELELEVVRELTAPLGIGARESNTIEQSCVIALGYLGDDDGDEVDERIRRALLAKAESGADRDVRHLALIGLGQVGGRRGQGNQVAVKSIRGYLQKRVVRGARESARWAALGLALLERSRSEAGDAGSEASRRALRSELERARTALDVGALSIAVGLLPDEEAGELLMEKLDVVAEDAPRGHVAVALGLIGETRAQDIVRRLVEDATFRPLLLQEAATGLALLGDESAVPILTDMLENANSSASLSAIARALGRIGDRRAVEPLLEILEDEGKTDNARAFAAVALGLVTDPRAVPWNTVLSLGTNPVLAPDTLYHVDGTGVLNIL